MTDVQQPVPDPNVGRLNAVVTTLLDALGTLLLAAGLGYGAWRVWGLGWGLCAAGLAVTILSMIAQARERGPRPVKVPPGAHPHREFLPGPEDPGTLHVKGR
jgi:hypothetical protein